MPFLWTCQSKCVMTSLKNWAYSVSAGLSHIWHTTGASWTRLVTMGLIMHQDGGGKQDRLKPNLWSFNICVCMCIIKMFINLLICLFICSLIHSFFFLSCIIMHLSRYTKRISVSALLLQYLKSGPVLAAFEKTHLNNCLHDRGEWNIKMNLTPSFTRKYTADGDKA